MSSITPAVLAVAALCALSPGLAQAQTEGTVQSPTVAALLACREITDQVQRVACLEEQVAAFAEALESGRVYVVEDEQVRDAERESFGFARNSLTSFANAIGLGRDRDGEDTGGAGEADQPGISFDDGVTAETDSSGRLSQLSGLTVASVTRNRLGRITIRLENGQVWRQTDDTTVLRVRDRHIEAGLTAEIQSGVLGAYFMRLSHSPRRFRAERVQ